MIFIYTRVSTLDQASDDKTSLAEQERRGRAWAAALMEEPEVCVISDPGVSGSTPLNERPGGISMLAQMKSGDIIVSLKLTRLFRSASDAITSVEDFHKQGIKVVLLDISPEPVKESGVGKMFFVILAAVAEFDKERVLEQMNDGKRAKIAKGGFAGGHAPYGFRQVGKGAHAVLAVHEGEQNVVRLIHSLKHGGRSLHQVSKELERRGLTNRVGSRFAPEQIKRIIERPMQEAAE